MAVMLVGCAPGVIDRGETTEDSVWYGTSGDFLQEQPAPLGQWRGHRLSWCDEADVLPEAVLHCLETCRSFFQEGSGSDGMMEMESCLEGGTRHPLVLATLAQLYLLAGQGEPSLLPSEGPAADVGDWSCNRRRLLGRARELLLEAAPQVSNEAAVDHLLADVSRAAEDYLATEAYGRAALHKCSGGPYQEVLRTYQILNRYPPKMLSCGRSDYPETMIRARVSGIVTLDLLIGADGRIWQAVVAESPAPALSRAALDAFLEGQFQPATVGKYPVWSWLRVDMAFNLTFD